MKKFLVDAAWALAALVLAFVLWMAASPARADGEPPPLALRMRTCEPPTCVMVQYTDLIEAISRSNANYQRALDAEAALAAERKAKTCAKVEVTEPSKAPKIVIPNDGTRKAS
jgi:hypothetical protein